MEISSNSYAIRKKRVRGIMLYIVLSIFAVICLYPVFFTLTSSLKKIILKFLQNLFHCRVLHNGKIMSGRGQLERWGFILKTVLF